MKKSLIYIMFAFLAGTVSLSSCTDYLEKDAESVLQEEDAFKNFNNFQGFVEVMYNVIPDVMKSHWTSCFNWGEDEVHTFDSGWANSIFTAMVDNGNYRGYINNSACFLDRPWAVGQIQGSSGARFDKALWGGSWYGILQANIGLKALQDGLLKDASQEQRNLIEGQLLFFRAWFYFELCTYWGGLPYITEPLDPGAQFNLPRESFQECADKMAEDFKRAADLLPINWDNTATGSQIGKGKNELRPNKIWALSYMGKALLYAGSPLMVNGVDATGDTYKYDSNYCKRAADAFGQVLSLVESGQTQYALVPFEDYHTLFWTQKQSWMMPGGTEAIMRSPSFGADSYWRQANVYQIKEIADGDGIVLCPAANYVNYFGMQNGLPLTEADSGFDKEHPWKNRDPRFYYNFIYDGVKMFNGQPVDKSLYQFQYANFYDGGNGIQDLHRSRTGYLNYKFIAIDCNTIDNGHSGWTNAFHLHLSWLRLADVYLMYAEAADMGYGGANGKSSTCSLTAADAVNKIRERAGVDPVDDRFLGSADKFMDEIRRERAVELSFEAHRFNDLRRWKLLTVYPYNIKTRQKFDRVPGANIDPETDSYHPGLDITVDPKENAVKNFREEVIIQRNLSAKHYWLPFKNEDVMIYPEFKQNPGW